MGFPFLNGVFGVDKVYIKRGVRAIPVIDIRIPIKSIVFRIQLTK
jgi:hypothetical protein